MIKTLAALVTVFLPAAATSAGEVDLVSRIFRQANLHGGMVVELGIADIQFTVALGTREAVTVQVLDNDPWRAASVRRQLASAGLSGKVTIEQFAGERLPYADNLVNMVVAHGVARRDGEFPVPREEILRVLAPGGVFCSVERQVDSTDLRITRKPWPVEIDEWTHFLHSAAGNAVAADAWSPPPPLCSGSSNRCTAAVTRLTRVSLRWFPLRADCSTSSMKAPLASRIHASQLAGS